MSWSRTLVIAAIMAVSLSACGFHPLYGRRSDAQGTDVVDRLATIRIAAIPDRNGQMLRNALLERLTPKGEPAAERYVLSVTLTDAVGGMGIQKDSTASLGKLDMTAAFVITELESGLGVAGAANSTVSMNFLGPRYASIAMERDAQERAITDIADSIRDQLAAALSHPEKLKRVRQQQQDQQYIVK